MHGCWRKRIHFREFGSSLVHAAMPSYFFLSGNYRLLSVRSLPGMLYNVSERESRRSCGGMLAPPSWRSSGASCGVENLTVLADDCLAVDALGCTLNREFREFLHRKELHSLCDLSGCTSRLKCIVEPLKLPSLQVVLFRNCEALWAREIRSVSELCTVLDSLIELLWSSLSFRIRSVSDCVCCRCCRLFTPVIESLPVLCVPTDPSSLPSA